MYNATKDTMIPEAPLRTGEIARYCHTTVMQVNRWIKSGSLKSFRTPGGQNRITREDFRKFLEQNGMPVIEDFFEETKVLKVMVADDDPAVVNAISHLLLAELKNIRLEKARDGYEVLIKSGDYKPDLLILDIRMPRVDGLEVCRRLRESDNITSGLKILAVTGHSEAYDREQVLECGADDYLLKPFNKETLLKHVKGLIQ